MSDQFKHPRIVTWSVDSVTPTVEDITSHGPDSSFSLSSWSGSIVLFGIELKNLNEVLKWNPQQLAQYLTFIGRPDAAKWIESSPPFLISLLL